LKRIKAEGGITFAQNHTARFDSMPRSAVAAGAVDFALAPRQIAEGLASIATRPE
jgi:two-component system CheB/CheR fusion protein